MCLERRLEGAEKFDVTWTIPAEMKKTKDARIKSGEYTKIKIIEIERKRYWEKISHDK